MAVVAAAAAALVARPLQVRAAPAASFTRGTSPRQHGALPCPRSALPHPHAAEGWEGVGVAAGWGCCGARVGGGDGVGCSTELCRWDHGPSMELCQGDQPPPPLVGSSARG